MRIIGVIPSRYQSSRFPGKALADICGRPMVWWVYQRCRQVSEFDEIIVATDDRRIKTVCDEYGMKVMMTSAEHKTGSDRVGEVAKSVEGDLFVNVQGDEPVIEPEMIREVIRIFEDETVYFGSLRKAITDRKEIGADSTVKVVVDHNEDAMYMSRNVIPSNIKENVYTKIYRHVGIYAYRKDFLLKFAGMKQSDLELGEGIEPLRALENGYKMRVKETQYSSIGVDYAGHIRQVEEFIQSHNMGCE